MRAFKHQRPDSAEQGPVGDHGRLDAMRSWLANGHHIFGVDPRRRHGHHGHARQLLADDLSSSQTSTGDWQALASALDRHTIRGGMAELSAEEQRVITLAYLEGRTNGEIAAMLGVSVSTVRRRLWLALKRLDAYFSRTRNWLSAIILLGAGYLSSQAHRLERFASADWTQKAAATMVIGAAATVAIGLTAVTPDTAGSMRSSAPATGRLIAAAPSLAVPESPSLVSNLAPKQQSAPPVSDPSTTTGPTVRVIPPLPAAGPPATTDAHHPNRGCHGNPTSAPPPVPVGRHAHGSPVTHPSAGGCRV